MQGVKRSLNIPFIVLVLLLACSRGSEPGLSARASGLTISAEDRLAASRQVSSEATAALRAIVAAGYLSDLRWPEFSDRRAEVHEFYESANYALAWVSDARATPQALTLIGLFRDAASQGLRPEDYDGPRWSGRLRRLNQSQPPPVDSDWARFDVALTVSTMRYVSDLSKGRVTPRQFQYALEINHNNYDVAEFLRQRLVDALDVEAALKAVEPPFPAYHRTVSAYQTYSKLARQGDAEPLSVPTKTVKPGDLYPGVPRLVRLLRRLGDLPSGVAGPADATTYEGALVDAVKHFQRRHGLESDGWIGRQTLRALNMPLSHRALQLRLALERWRWLPHEFAQPPIIVNIPEFGLHAYNTELRWALSTKVVVGRAYQHQTPVFASEMKYVILRPPWNVPLSIQIKELVPAARKDPNYFVKGNYEITDRQGTVVSDGETNEVILNELRSGKLAIRQRPGPNNSLGLIKFVLPNDHDVYLHGTPAMALFTRPRRDFSHGCIRVEDPVALAAWVLRNQPQWTPESIRAAMNGDKTVRVGLDQRIPVLILYTTAVVMEDGEVRFFEDIYNQDTALQEALARAYPDAE